MRDIFALIWRIIRPGNPIGLRAEDGVMEILRSRSRPRPAGPINAAGPYSTFIPAGGSWKVTKRARPRIIHTVTPIRARR